MPAKYSLVGESSLVLSVPAAELQPTPSEATVAVHSAGEPLPAIDVVALFPTRLGGRARRMKPVKWHSTYTARICR